MADSTEKAKREFNEQLKEFAKEDLPVLRNFLMNTVKGKNKDQQFDQKQQKMVKRQVPTAVKVDACNAYTKMILSRTVAEVKEDKEKGGKEQRVDDALKKVEQRKLEEKKKREAEEKAQAAGKLVKIGGQ